MFKITNLIHGYFMGAAEILPGISGSTCALILGIYDDFINLLYQISLSIRVFLKVLIGKESFSKFKTTTKEINFKFGIPILFGMALAIISLSHFLTYVLENYPNYIYGFFFGLGISSITIPFGEMKQRTFRNFAIVIISFILAFTLFGLKTERIQGEPSYIMLFLSGLVGISGTVLPGASGSYLLIVTGVYDYIVNSVKEFSTLNFSVTAVLHMGAFAMGLLVGFVILVRIVKFGLQRSPNRVMALIIGVMLGATRVTYPFVSAPENSDKTYYSPFKNANEYNVILVWLSFFAAVGLILFMNFYSDRRQFKKINGK